MKVFEDYKDKIVYPITTSWKYDGIFAKVKNGKFYSKNDKLFNCLDASIYEDNIEGELYNHELFFEDICSAVKRKTPNELTKDISFYPHNLIPNKVINNEDELFKELKNALSENYEGLVLNTNICKLKLKPWYDEEYVITNVTEGKGKLLGMAGSIVCGNIKFKMKGSFEYLTKLWEDRDNLIGKLATVEFQNKTKYGIPRFPKGKAIRDYE